MSFIMSENKKIRVIEQFLECTYQDAQAASRWVSKQSIGLQELVNNRGLKLYLKIRERNPEISKDLLSIGANLNIAFKTQDVYKKAHRKNVNFQSEDIVLLDTLELNNFTQNKRVSKKRKYLKKRVPQILKWRSLDVSWAVIASRLLTIEGETISAEYIRTTITSLKDVS